MMEQGFRGNCDSQGKLGMCSSLAEPDSGGRTSLRENGLQRPAKGVPPLLLPAAHITNFYFFDRL